MLRTTMSGLAVIVLALALQGPVTGQAPPNDTCAAAQPVMVPGQPFMTLGATTDGATLTGNCDPGPSADDQIHNDVWYCWTAPSGGLAMLTVFTIFDQARVAIYDSCTCPPAAASVVACAEPLTPMDPVTEVTFACVAGASYLIRIGGTTAGAMPDGDFIVDTLGPLGSDDCANAQAVNLGAVTDYNNFSASTDGPDLAPFCDPGPGMDDQIHEDVWYCWTAANSGPYRIEYLSTSNAARIAVYDGCSCPPLASAAVVCGEVVGTVIAQESFSAAAGNSYLIRVGSAQSGQSVSGNFLISSDVPALQNLVCDDSVPNDVALSWSLGGTYSSIDVRLNGTIIQTLSGGDTSFLYSYAPGFVGTLAFSVRGVTSTGLASAYRHCSVTIGAVTNDDCDDAITIAAGTHLFDTTTADDGPMPFLFCAMPPNDMIVHDIWYRYVAPTSTAVTIATCGSSFDTTLALYADTGLCLPAPMLELACSFDDCALQSTISYNVSAGSTYLIRVGGALTPGGPPFGPGELLIDDGTAVPMLDLFDRGDCNNDASFNIADAVTLLNFLFPVGTAPTLDCEDACDGNDDASLNIADAVAMLSTLFPTGTPVPLPDPFGSCAADPTSDSLSCDAYAHCP